MEAPLRSEYAQSASYLSSNEADAPICKVTILTLATGIGAATTMYSVIHNVLLNPFPYTDPRRMVDVIAHNLENQRQIGPLTIPEFRAFVDESNIFEEAVGTNTTPMLYRTDQGPEQLSVAAVTPNLFHFLGVLPVALKLTKSIQNP